MITIHRVYGKWEKFTIVMVLLFTGICTGCIHQGESGGTEAPYMEDYFRGDFAVTGEPVLNQEVEVVFSVTPITDSIKTKIYMYLPEGIELVQGDLYWEGDIKKGDIVQIKITVKSIQEGQWVMSAYVEGLLDGEADKNLDYFLYFLTSKDTGQVSRTRFYYEYEPEGRAIELAVVMISDAPHSTKVGEEVVLTFSLIASKDSNTLHSPDILVNIFM